jgi:hypothetical protein
VQQRQNPERRVLKILANLALRALSTEMDVQPPWDRVLNRNGALYADPPNVRRNLAIVAGLRASHRRVIGGMFAGEFGVGRTHPFAPHDDNAEATPPFPSSLATVGLGSRLRRATLELHPSV